MDIRIIHSADLHMDSPFEALPPEKAALRRREQRELLRALGDLARSEKAQLVLLAGDLFDSALCYWETQSALCQELANMPCRVFISPGNHDWYGPRSPYRSMELPENVHVFTSPEPECVALPELGCRVWGAGFTSASSGGLLRGFSVPDDGVTDIMVLHGDISGGEMYCPVTKQEIAASGLDYLALGHVHAYSGILREGDTFYAYPGCPEGRGFDELGQKGVIVGTVGHGRAELRFVPVHGRKYEVVKCDITDEPDIAEAVRRAVPEGAERDVYRVILTGRTAEPADLDAAARALEGRVWHLQLRDSTLRRRDMWQSVGDDTLKGLFLREMKKRLDAAPDEETRALILEAAGYGAGAIENREELGL